LSGFGVFGVTRGSCVSLNHGNGQLVIFWNGKAPELVSEFLSAVKYAIRKEF
jgi:hypothetical protein